MIHLCAIWFDHYLLKAWRKKERMQDSAAWLIISCVYVLEIGHMLQSDHSKFHCMRQTTYELHKFQSGWTGASNNASDLCLKKKLSALESTK